MCSHSILWLSYCSCHLVDFRQETCAAALCRHLGFELLLSLVAELLKSLLDPNMVKPLFWCHPFLRLPL